MAYGTYNVQLPNGYLGYQAQMPTGHLGIYSVRLPSADSPPSTPANLQAIAQANQQIALSWEASTDVGGGSLASYELYRDTVFLISIPEPTLTHVDSGLDEWTEYDYTISAKDDQGNESEQSGIVTERTLDETDPSIPTGLILDVNDGVTVDFHWTAATDPSPGSGVKGYNVYRDDAGFLAGTFNTSYSDSPVTPGASYTYTLKTEDWADNESAASSGLQVTIPVDFGQVIQSKISVADTTFIGGAVTFDTPPISGNLILYFCCTDGAADTITQIGIGGLTDAANISDDITSKLFWKISEGNEGTLNASWLVAARYTIIAIEFQGPFVALPFDDEATNTSGGAVSSINTGASQLPLQADNLAIAMFNSNDTGDIRDPIAWTDGYIQDAGTNHAADGVRGYPGTSIASKILASAISQDPAFSWSVNTDQAQARILIFKKA